jgi:hypothetical protein
MNKLKQFTYKPTTPVLPTPPAPTSSQDDTITEDPATPIPQRIPLSDLLSNTPIRQGTCQDVSPEEKVVWKLSPKKILDVPFPSQESPRANRTTFLNLLNGNENKKVPLVWAFGLITGVSTCLDPNVSRKFFSPNSFDSES